MRSLGKDLFTSLEPYTLKTIRVLNGETLSKAQMNLALLSNYWQPSAIAIVSRIQNIILISWIVTSNCNGLCNVICQIIVLTSIFLAILKLGSPLSTTSIAWCCLVPIFAVLRCSSMSILSEVVTVVIFIKTFHGFSLNMVFHNILYLH